LKAEHRAALDARRPAAATTATTTATTAATTAARLRGEGDRRDETEGAR